MLGFCRIRELAREGRSRFSRLCSSAPMTEVQQRQPSWLLMALSECSALPQWSSPGSKMTWEGLLVIGIPGGRGSLGTRRVGLLLPRAHPECPGELAKAHLLPLLGIE